MLLLLDLWTSCSSAGGKETGFFEIFLFACLVYMCVCGVCMCLAVLVLYALFFPEEISVNT